MMRVVEFVCEKLMGSNEQQVVPTTDNPVLVNSAVFDELLGTGKITIRGLFAVDFKAGDMALIRDHNQRTCQVLAKQVFPGIADGKQIIEFARAS